MSHITAGDIFPIATKSESTYGTPTGTYAYYADVKGDGGNFTPLDNPNPYVAWRGGRRNYNIMDYVPTNYEAGYTDVLEVEDKAGWEAILTNALGSTDNGGIQLLPSRTTAISVLKGDSTSQYDILTYYGCKTDRLEIRADQPGGIVEFDETVLASYSAKSSGASPAVASAHTMPAVQWVGGVTLDNTAIYPQNLRLSINNNLGRVKGPVTANSGKAGTVGLVEGRIEAELQMDVWMEDLQAINENGPGFTGPAQNHRVEFTLGNGQAVDFEVNCYYMADGQHPGLIQDKQIQTLRFRACEIEYTVQS